MPWWAQLFIGLFTGGFAKSVIDLIRDRDRHAWAEIRRLNAENQGLRDKLAECEKKAR